tara:strand:- start:5421 stop:5663 length:243 start_codon:yes stop_codon:yes gene_type:complete
MITPADELDQKVEQPADTCRILLFDDFNSDKGSIEPKLSGRIRLSVNKGGCYMSTIRSGGKYSAVIVFSSPGLIWSFSQE